MKLPAFLPDFARARALAAFVALTAVVTWLFVKADGVPMADHHAFLLSLSRMQKADEALNASIVSAYSDLLQNYDPLMLHSRAIGEERQAIQYLPAALPGPETAILKEKRRLLAEAQMAKERDIDLFTRHHSVLRNSEFYFPTLAEECLARAAGPMSGRFEHFTRHLLRFSINVDPEGEEQLADELAGLERDASASGDLLTRQFLIHARQIVQRRPEVNTLMQRIVKAPTAALLEEVSQAYAQAHGEAERVADYYRAMLYLVTVLLGSYVVYALLRNERDRRALAVHQAGEMRAEAQLRLYSRVFTNASEGMTITDAQANIVAVNPAFCEITGYAATDVIGKTPAILNSGRQGKDFYREMWAELLRHGQWQGEIWNRRKDGGIFPEWLSISSVLDEQGKVSHYIGVFADISERKQSEARIQHLAHHDALTGLPNRLLLEDRMTQGMLKSKRAGKSMAVIFIDLDRFKNINDTLGHEVGDNLLVQASQRGQAILRDTDTLSRLGGDEFVAVLPELGHRNDASQVARKLLAMLCQPYLLAGHELTVSASAGIALYPEDGQSASELMRKADAAMYRAKEEGRNTFRFFSAEINTASLGDLLLENELFGALERGELEMYYQPKVDARDGRIVGAEALMRWRHRKQGMIPPARFIPLAEASGLINVFGEWAIETVCRQQRHWREAGVPVLPVAVNISAQQFAQQDLPELVAKVLQEHALAPRLLELELTESSLMRNATKASGVLEVLRRMHVHVAIDDFGTGYSSLSYLKQFPVHTLKIDHSFVNEIDEHGERIKLASAIIAMAHELDLSVVAEGVETEAQRAYLLAHGCDQFQGYLFGLPMTAGEYGELLANLPR